MWLKLGGDKGGGSFKMSFQLCNVPSPNAPDNTCVFAIYEAPDNVVNLHIALDQYQEQVCDISRSTWRLILFIIIQMYTCTLHCTYNVEERK